MSQKKLKSNPITSKQKEMMVEFISARKTMYTGKLTPSYTREKMKENWMELTNILNSVPQGPAKDWMQWRKTWVDLKKNMKARFSNEKKYATSTGGRPPLPPADIEKKFLTIISPVAIQGDENIEESMVHFDFADENDDLHNETESENMACSSLLVNPFIAPEVEHDYGSHSSTQNDLSRNKAVTTSRTSEIQKKRLTKTKRLQESLRTNDRFLKINEENVESKKLFRKRQLDIMEKNSKIKETYYEKKLVILETIADAAAEIATGIKELKDMFC